MDNSFYLLAFISISGVILLILVLRYYPALLIRSRFLSRGIRLDWETASRLYYPACLKKDFLPHAVEILRVYNTDMEILWNHHQLGGKLYNIRNGVLSLDQANIQFDMQDILTLDLLGWTLDDSLHAFERDGKLNLAEALLEGPR